MNVKEKRAMLEAKLRTGEKVANDNLADAALVVRAFGHMSDRVKYTQIKHALRKQEVIAND